MKPRINMFNFSNSLNFIDEESSSENQFNFPSSYTYFVIKPW